MYRQRFLTVDRNPEFNRRIMNAFAGSNETFNLQKHGREYKVDISRVESGENLAGILLLAFDVTEQAETEKCAASSRRMFLMS